MEVDPAAGGEGTSKVENGGEKVEGGHAPLDQVVERHGKELRKAASTMTANHQAKVSQHQP
jgi:hypothetical protein